MYLSSIASSPDAASHCSLHNAAFTPTDSERESAGILLSQWVSLSFSDKTVDDIVFASSWYEHFITLSAFHVERKYLMSHRFSVLKCLKWIIMQLLLLSIFHSLCNNVSGVIVTLKGMFAEICLDFSCDLFVQ